jgi:DnaJ-class molecular chaperone
MDRLLDQYQAACLIGISPDLLKYLTERTVKKDDARKLQIARRDGDNLWFSETELRAYNEWLFQPWPADGKKRPHLPSAIRDEVKYEAAGECAICSKHGNSCEAAHIAPVAVTKCNHPHNLLWLCANHHTKFDNGSLGPKGVDNELVKASKRVLQHARKHVWQRAADASVEIAALLRLAKDTAARLMNSASQSDLAVAEDHGKKVLELLSAATAQRDPLEGPPVRAKIAALVGQQGASGTGTTTIAEKLCMVASFEDEFQVEAGLKNCPLCLGSKWHNEQECPVCQGDGTVEKEYCFDRSPYELVACGHCNGDRRIDGEDCPACHGEGQIEARFFDRIDWSSFKKIKCRHCDGNRRINGEDCPACHGEGEIETRFSDLIDWSSFRKIKCRHCDGNRRIDGEDCPACHGEGEMEARFSDAIDWSSYKTVLCPLCTGDRNWRGEDCPACRGEGQMLRRVADTVDLSEYRDVECPLCEGTGTFDRQTCPECDGARKMEQWRAESVKLSQYGLDD